jgi:hypothetical protein
MTDDASPLDDAFEGSALALLRVLLDLDATVRDDALQQRSDDPALIARVRQLLAQVDESELDAPAPLDLPFGPYRARERIGQGGMGEVFRAERADGSFQRHVAIKRMHGGYAGLAARFLRERQLLARLQHPNIAQLIDGGFDAQGQPWLAMELVAGQPIHRWCDLRQATLDTRVRLMIQLCRAVDHAHRHLVVHRDLKPGNVLVDAEGNAKLLDFGIARLLDDDAEHTHTHAMTPAWSAPEQRKGEPATTASDLYQLGLLLRLLLSGFPPSPAPGRLSRQFDDLALDDRPAAQALAEARGTTADTLSRRLRGDLDAIVALATAEDPAQRYPAASAFAADLERWLDGLPVAARDTERGYRLRRAARRYWPALAAGVAALAFLGYHMHSMNSALRRVEAERKSALSARALEADHRRRAERERDRANVVADYFGELFDVMPPAQVARGDVPAHQLLERGMSRLLQDRTMPPQTRSELLVATASALDYLDRDASQRKALDEAIALLSPATAETGDGLAGAYSSLALAHNLQGDYASAGEAYRAGWALYETGMATDPITRNQLRIVEAMLADRAGDKQRSAALYRTILPDTKRMLGTTKQLRAVRNHIGALTNLAQLEKDPVVSERLYREALALCEARDPYNQSLRFAVRNSLVNALIRQTDYDRAETLAEETLRLARGYFVDTDSWLGLIYANAAKLDLVRGRFARASDRFDISLRIAERGFGVDNPISARIREDAAMTDLAADRFEAGERKLRALSARAAADGSDVVRADVARAYIACRRLPSPERIGRLRAALDALPAAEAKKFVFANIDWIGRCTGAGPQRTEAASS